MKFLDTSALVGKDVVKTSSAMRKWWLTQMKGYRIENVVEHPAGYVLGRVTYTRTWFLRPPGS